jgi:hypothetical protein
MLTMRAAVLALVIVAPTLLAGSWPAAAQDAPPSHPAGLGVQAEHAAHDGHEAHHSPLVEAEFAGSVDFRSGDLSVKLGSPVRADLRYFGVEGNEIGMVGLGWEFRWRGLRFIPGAAWSFGRENKPAPVITARWVFENEHWTSQGAWVQSLGEYSPSSSHQEHAADHEHGGEAETIARHASVLDGIHVSRRIGRFDVGPMIEHIDYREEDEWKAGGRVAVRLGTSFRLIAQVVGPGTEVRGGFVWER